MNIYIITLFPEALKPYLNESILGRAQKKKLINIEYYNPRDFSKDKHKRVDEKPYGGGPGMVMVADPILNAVNKARGRKKNVKVIILSPRGRQFTNALAITLSKKYKDIILISGRYEGIDARVKKILRAEEVSIGPYVLTGGELPAAIVVDSIARQIRGVLGKDESIEEKRNASHEVYTRPEIVKHKGKNYKVPRVLLSGNHKDIEEWRENR